MIQDLRGERDDLVRQQALVEEDLKKLKAQRDAAKAGRGMHPRQWDELMRKLQADKDALARIRERACELNRQIKAYNCARAEGMTEAFVQIARETLPAPLFETLMSLTDRRLEENRKSVSKVDSAG